MQMLSELVKLSLRSLNCHSFRTAKNIQLLSILFFSDKKPLQKRYSQNRSNLLE